MRAITALGGAAPAAADQAIDFINRLDKARYASLQVDLDNAVTAGYGAYPVTLVDAYNLPSRRREVRRVENGRGDGSPQTEFRYSQQAERQRERKGE